MKLSTSLVAIKKISCNKPRSNFDDDKLEQAAQLILECEGVINPIVVRRTSLQSFELVDGYFEYHAAARAREIDPRKGEMIGVFIIEDENEEILTKQVQLFRQPKSDTSTPSNLTVQDLEKLINNLESRFDKLTTQLFDQASANARLENEVKDLKKQIAKKVDPLEVFQKLKPFEMAEKLVNAGVNSKRASQIAEVVEIERKKEQFQSLNDVVERVKIPHGKKTQRAISSEKMLDIVDIWSKNS
ncbi:ParB N-terminal domain-containing protein [Anabaena lutea]|uniref:ParB N-terminal domain-containing protein n=1 Tax=Anabaena lutea FACHB-196 TaxID=2692881 RepID=A0ABR8FH51_9NOST|nr:ParB N-terminal domain-containing protein [Anabaena lutea]MBD2569555.1 ParB N-terminal domain-containing protein [Anabaena lutea FACHB-196]